MDTLYNDGIAILRRWRDERAKLWVQFWEPSQTAVSGRCFISELTDEKVTLQFGAIALGTLTLTLPISGVFVAPDAFFNYSKVDDAPASNRPKLEAFDEFLEIKYRFWGNGCSLFHFKDFS